ncbi:putative ribonuclease H-like domain-containing protein [Rosa chinensis]|uniref:Putative ribonuclease H-like domain-containing protein n=1 Tax=Rosa chinensis TaxID=74649 RepID=A0A2P6PYD2_ROSCH|nr:putative ribonuclease H-like domain-containing protein [Rosa chinensis]
MEKLKYLLSKQYGRVYLACILIQRKSAEFRLKYFLEIYLNPNSVHELTILKSLQVSHKPRRAPRIVEVNWFPPLIGWVKINTDGDWRSASGQAGFGGVFRDYHVAAEVMAVIKAIDLAWVRDWKHMWLKVDSSLILNLLKSPQLVPWQWRVEWGNCLHCISQMHFHSSHIFREGNQVADAFANFGLSSAGLIWVSFTSPSYVFLFLSFEIKGRWRALLLFYLQS